MWVRLHKRAKTRKITFSAQCGVNCGAKKKNIYLHPMVYALRKKSEKKIYLYINLWKITTIPKNAAGKNEYFGGTNMEQCKNKEKHVKKPKKTETFYVQTFQLNQFLNKTRLLFSNSIQRCVSKNGKKDTHFRCELLR